MNIPPLHSSSPLTGVKRHSEHFRQKKIDRLNLTPQLSNPSISPQEGHPGSGHTIVTMQLTSDLTQLPDFVPCKRQRREELNTKPAPRRWTNLPKCEGRLLVFDKHWTYGDKEIPLEERRCEGFSHVVRFFKGDDFDVRVQTSSETSVVSIDPAKTVIKYANAKNNRASKAKNANTELERGVAAYSYLKDRGMPVPHVYATPLTLVEDTDKRTHHPVWIIERLSPGVEDLIAACKDVKSIAEIPTESMEVLEFAKGWIKKIAEHAEKTGHELINDFHPNNIGIRKSGDTKEFVMWDFSLPEDGNKIWKSLCTHIVQWSAGNPTIYDFLVDLNSDTVDLRVKLEPHRENEFNRYNTSKIAPIEIPSFFSIDLGLAFS